MPQARPRTGVLLIQLGTPKAPTVPAVRRFLREFLVDPRVIDIPAVFRFLLVHLIIAPFRAYSSTKIYKALWYVGEGDSPIRTHTVRLTELLNEQLSGEGITVHMAMRYQGPAIEDVLETMRHERYDKILILPLFPHYASSSSGTALQKAMEVISRWWVIPDVECVSQYYREPFYIDTVVEQTLKHDLGSFDHILMSYHGLPVRHMDKVYPKAGDLCADHGCEDAVDVENAHCYKATVYETSRLVAAKLGLDEDAYTVTFQSRLNDRWLRPFSDKVIVECAEKGMKRLLVLSPAFVADCLETLIEVGSEYHVLFTEHGGEVVQLVDSCNTEATWVDGLAGFLRERAARLPSR